MGRAARAESRYVAAPVRRPPLPATARWWLLAIVLACIPAFGPAISAPFQFDDIAAISDNHTIDRLWPPSALATQPPRSAVSGRPVVNYSLAINRAIDRVRGATGSASRTSTTSYHVINLLLHIATGLLLFGLIRRTVQAAFTEWSSSAEGVALAVTGIWLLHPIQTEAVNYVVQRTELLVSICYLGTLYASTRAWDASSTAGRRAWSAVAVTACVLGMGSKEVMVSAPFAVMLYDYAFRAASWRELWRNRGRAALYLALLATLSLLAVLVATGARADSVGFGLGITWYAYFYSQMWAIAHYVRLLAWPSGLTYDYGEHAVGGMSGVPGFILLLAFGAATVWAWTRPRWRWFAFLGTCFFLLLGPSSSVVPIRTEIAAERRVYLASAALIVLAVVGAEALRRRVIAARSTSIPAWRIGTWAAAIAGCTYYVLASARRSALYQNPEGLWRDAMITVPSNARAYENVAAVIVRADARRIPEADSLLRAAIAVDSTYLTAWTNLAELELEQNHTPQAKDLLDRVLRINPDFVDAQVRLGGVLVKLGESPRAIPLLERAAATHATDEIWVTLASAYLATGRQPDAMAALGKAVELNPRRADASSYLGVQLMDAGRPDQALPYLEAAAAAGGGPGLTYALLSLAYAQLGRQVDAGRVAADAVGRAGNDPTAFVALGRTMLLLGHAAEAISYFGEGVRLAPTDPEAVTRLGIARAAMGDQAAAADLFRRALQLQPGYPPAVQALAKLGR
jgi:tetratricopeptide (TPR) repeat protein